MERQIELLEMQRTTTYIFIIVTLVLTTISTSDINKLKGLKPLYSDSDAYNIEITSRIIVLVLLFSYLYINIESKKINANKKSYNLQIGVSILTIIAGIITLYVAYDNNQSSLENPIV